MARPTAGKYRGTAAAARNNNTTNTTVGYGGQKGGGGMNDDGAHHDPALDIVDCHKMEAEKWLGEELKRSNLSYLKEGHQYSPWICSKKDGTIPMAHLESALNEYKRRFGDGSNQANTATPAVLLVATGVGKEWMPGEEVGKARFLLFPELGAAKTSALFITYMPGPEHGAVDSWFVAMLSVWHTTNEFLRRYLSYGGLSSGGYGCFQPDKRVFPFKENRDHNGRDADRANKNNPYSRFIWEIEYDNRDPVQIRERGRAYMTPKYVRLFLAMKLYPPSRGTTYEAAAVLWAKADEESDTITVMKAVSFGTQDLSDDHKQDFFQRKADRLVGVDVNHWEKARNDEAAWSITLPFRGFLFKVSKGAPGENGTTEYVLDDLEAGAVEDFVIDLRRAAREYENQVLE